MEKNEVDKEIQERYVLAIAEIVKVATSVSAETGVPFVTVWNDAEKYFKELLKTKSEEK